MALHRDIFWIGRQWAVTGFGMQAINQKHGGQFDIAIERQFKALLCEGLLGCLDEFPEGDEIQGAGGGSENVGVSAAV